jgi:hypothetical protein
VAGLAWKWECLRVQISYSCIKAGRDMGSGSGCGIEQRSEMRRYKISVSAPLKLIECLPSLANTSPAIRSS